MATILILHPGAMGASIADTLVSIGHRVSWVADGRSDATAERAGTLDRRETLADGLADADLVVAVCPPASAVTVASAVAGAGYRGRFLDANAVAPATAREVASIVSAAGGTPIDGGIVGPPARRPGTTRLFLSGDDASAVADLFTDTTVDAIVVDGPVGAASAAKVAYAAWTKGSSALLLAVAAYADAEGVTGVLRDEWARSQPDLVDRLALTAPGVAPKAWRFAGELADSGRAFADAGLPEGFGAAAADVYERLAGFRDRHGVTVDDVIGAINDAG